MLRRRASAHVDGGREGFASTLGRARELSKEFFVRIDRYRVTGLAAEMAFWLFLSLLPIAAVCGLLAARFAVSNGNAVDPILQSFPPAAREAMTKELASVAAWNGGAVGPISALVFVWLASSGIHAIFDALEVGVGVARPWWKKRIVAIGTCVVLSVGVAGVALLATGVTWIANVAGTHVPVVARLHSSLGGGFARALLGAVVSFGLIAFLYWAGFPTKAHRRHMPIAPGAAFVVVLNAVLGFAYGFYVSKAGTGDAYTAGLAVVGVALTALYLFALAVLFGAELNQMLGEARGCVEKAHAASSGGSSSASKPTPRPSRPTPFAI